MTSHLAVMAENKARILAQCVVVFFFVYCTEQAIVCKQLKNMVLGFVFILRELTETCMFVFWGLQIFSTNSVI